MSAKHPLERWLKTKGITAYQLAKSTKISQGALSALMNRENNSPPRPSTVATLCAATGLEPASFYTETPHPVVVWMGQRGLKVAQLAKRLDISATYLYALLAGSRETPEHLVGQLAKETRIPAADLQSWWKARQRKAGARRERPVEKRRLARANA